MSTDLKIPIGPVSLGIHSTSYSVKGLCMSRIKGGKKFCPYGRTSEHYPGFCKIHERSVKTKGFYKNVYSLRYRNLIISIKKYGSVSLDICGKDFFELTVCQFLTCKDIACLLSCNTWFLKPCINFLNSSYAKTATGIWDDVLLFQQNETSIILYKHIKHTKKLLGLLQ